MADDEQAVVGALAGVGGGRPEVPDPDVAVGAVTLPGFELGGRVERTGIALVHEGEYVVPAPGSAAVLSPASGGPPGEAVTWTFPVEVEIVGALSEEHLRAVASHVFDELDIALRGLG